ncbi:fructosyl amine:oxygen oxidoreductase [Geranomyces variabilis]|nr:fructosyl amine:oxygen oxidoreductase [Geranomyces variabilis]KAJ3137082.1 hypothetical protein HDU90_002253 [Geranomyces variabilis]
MTRTSRESSILIIGGGTWGCSSSLELARRGYTNITVLDAHPIPSPIAAGNDVNKIMEESAPSETDSDELYVWNRMHEIATKAWRTDPVYSPFYHPTGFVMAASTDIGAPHVENYIRTCKYPTRRLETPDDFRETMPTGVLTGTFPNWKGFILPDKAGWVFARDALESAHKEAERLGVKFVTGGMEGKVVELFYSDSGDVQGAITADGKTHLADRTILCAGANSDGLFDFEKQLRPTAWTLAHIQMTPEERDTWKDLPVLFNVEKGFFMEPTAATGELKLVDEHPGYCNILRDSKTGEERSVPFAHHQIPLEAERRARNFLRETVPHIAERPFVFARVCWDCDTPDRQFIIATPPRCASLVVAVGGSGMGFMLMPAVGKAIADTLEGVIEPRLKKGFRWRPETAVDRDWFDPQGRYGGGNKVMNFATIGDEEWTRIGEGSQHVKTINIARQ